MSGGRSRKRRSPEQALQRQVVSWLREALPAPPAGPWWTHPHNEGWRSPAEAGIAKAMGQARGAPDLIFCYGGTFFAIELKAPKGHVTRGQRLTHEAIPAAGGWVYVCRSLAAVRDVLVAEGIPVRGTAGEPLGSKERV